MVNLDRSVSLIVNSGPCEDVVDHYQGFTSITATFAPGLVLPVVTLAFNLADQSDVRCFRQGEESTIIFGVDSGDLYLAGTVLKTKVLSVTQHYALSVSIVPGLDFANDFINFYHDGDSTSALESILSRYFEVTNDAGTPDDRMVWMGYGVAKRLAMNVWLRSYYGDDNVLLVGIDPEGARLVDLMTAAGGSDWKLGTDDSDDAKVDAVSVENRKPLAQDGLDRDVLSDTIIKPVEYTLNDPDPEPSLVSEVNLWRKGRRRIIEAQYSEKGPVHENWSRALAVNTGYLSLLRPVVKVAFRGYLPIRMFDTVDLNVRDHFPQLELGGKFLVGSITYQASDGRFTTVLGLMREELSL